MRVDCYNACECPISALDYGDTFYYADTVCMRVSTFNNVFGDDCAYVRLDTGEVWACKPDLAVVKADTKVVANTKDTF